MIIIWGRGGTHWWVGYQMFRYYNEMPLAKVFHLPQPCSVPLPLKARETGFADACDSCPPGHCKAGVNYNLYTPAQNLLKTVVLLPSFQEKCHLDALARLAYPHFCGMEASSCPQPWGIRSGTQLTWPPWKWRRLSKPGHKGNTSGFQTWRKKDRYQPARGELTKEFSSRWSCLESGEAPW